MAERDDRELSPEEQAAAEAQAAKRRKRLIYGVIAAAVLVLVLGGIIIWLLLREPDPEIQAAQAAQNQHQYGRCDNAINQALSAFSRLRLCRGLLFWAQFPIVSFGHVKSPSLSR